MSSSSSDDAGASGPLLGGGAQRRRLNPSRGGMGSGGGHGGRDGDSRACGDTAALCVLVPVWIVAVALLVAGIFGLTAASQSPRKETQCVVVRLGWDASNPTCREFSAAQAGEGNCSCAAAHVAYYAGKGEGGSTTTTSTTAAGTTGSATTGWVTTGSSTTGTPTSATTTTTTTTSTSTSTSTTGTPPPPPPATTGSPSPPPPPATTGSGGNLTVARPLSVGAAAAAAAEESVEWEGDPRFRPLTRAEGEAMAAEMQERTDAAAAAAAALAGRQPAGADLQRANNSGVLHLPDGWKLGIVPAPIPDDLCKLPDPSSRPVIGPHGIPMLWNTTCYFGGEDEEIVSLDFDAVEYDGAIAAICAAALLATAGTALVFFCRYRAGRTSLVPLRGEEASRAPGHVSYSNFADLLWLVGAWVTVLLMFAGTLGAVYFGVVNDRRVAYGGMGTLGYLPVYNHGNCFLQYATRTSTNNSYSWSPDCAVNNLPLERWTTANFKGLNETELGVVLSSWGALQATAQRSSIFSGVLSLSALVLGVVTVCTVAFYRSWRVAASRVGWRELSDRSTRAPPPIY